MPISTSLYTELRFAISDYMQRGEWSRLFDVCGTSDDEASRTIAVIMAGYEPRSVWRFLDYVANLKPETRQQKRESVATCCYTIAKIGQTNVRKSLSYLRQFLVENSALHDPVSTALSNLWVLNPRTTSSILLNSWILKNDKNDMLQQVSVYSCAYLATKSPNSVANFLLKISALDQSIAAKTAKQMLRKYSLPSRAKREPRKPRIHKVKKTKRRKRARKKLQKGKNHKRRKS
ncbi:MAG: hypothetical protein ACYCPW_12215 [Nitrososphaerales archaeon]